MSRKGGDPEPPSSKTIWCIAGVLLEVPMRSRNIKPGYFKNEDLAECEPLARILYAGLWCMADREGRLEYRPKRIKAELLPYDNCDITSLLEQLRKYGFVVAYKCNEQIYLSIPTFTEHQNCHIKEGESTIPAPDEHHTSTVLTGPLTDSLLLIPDSLNKPIVTIKKKRPKIGYTADFESFWSAYPKRVGKASAFREWERTNGNRPSIENIISAIQIQKRWRESSGGEFRPQWKDPERWIKNECWLDEVNSTKVSAKKLFGE